MFKLPKDFKKEFGKHCISYFFILNAAAFIMPLIDDKIVSDNGKWIVVAISMVLIVVGIYFLKDSKPLPGKWKRVKVRKDTTIHIEEEE